MSSLGDLYGDLDKDPDDAGGAHEDGDGGGLDAAPPGVGTEERPREVASNVSETLMLLKRMGVPIDEARFFELAMDPRPFRGQDTVTMQLPHVMKDFMSKLTGALQVLNSELSKAQIQRCMVALLCRRADELLDMCELATQEAEKQRNQR
jgi:hypothetical protein